MTDDIIYYSSTTINIHARGVFVDIADNDAGIRSIKKNFDYNRSRNVDTYIKLLNFSVNRTTKQHLMIYYLIIKLDKYSIISNENNDHNVNIYPKEVFLVNNTNKKITKENLKETIISFDELKKLLVFDRKDMSINGISLNNFKDKINDKIKKYDNNLNFNISIDGSSTELGGFNFQIIGNEFAELRGQEDILKVHKMKDMVQLESSTLSDLFNDKLNNILKSSLKFARVEKKHFYNFINYIIPHSKSKVHIRNSDLDKAIGITSEFDGEILSSIQNSEVFKERVEDFETLVTGFIKRGEPVQISASNITFVIRVHRFKIFPEFKLFSNITIGIIVRTDGKYKLTDAAIKVLAHLYNKGKMDQLIDKLELKTLK